MSNEENLYQPPSTEPLESNSLPPTNPHNAGLQILGMFLASVPLLLLRGWLLIVVGLCVFADAWYAGIYKDPQRRSFLNMSPMAWGIVVQWFFIIGFVLYILNRKRLKTKPGNPAFYVLTLIFGTLTIIGTGLLVYWAWYSAPLASQAF